MKILKIAVCDDDLLLARIMAETIQKTFLQYNVQSEVVFYDRLTILKRQLEQKNFDLLFLDIDMPLLDGITFGKQLRASHNPVTIIYVSGHEERVFESFDAKPYFFMRKTTFLEEIGKVVQRFVKEMENTAFHSLLVKDEKNSLLSLNIGQIVYIEGEMKLQKVFLLGQKSGFRVKSTLNHLEQELEPKGLLRAHKAYLVNSRYIRRIESGIILLSTGVSIPLGRTKAKEFLNAYVNLMA